LKHIILCLSLLLAATTGRADNLLAVLETGEDETLVDTIVLTTENGLDTVPTPDFGGPAGVTDTADLGSHVSMPRQAELFWFYKGNRQRPFLVAEVIQDTWYPLPVFGPTRIKFAWSQGIEELPGTAPVAGLVASPNPFRQATRVSCQVSEAGRVQVSVFDRSGRTVRTLADARFEPGTHRFSWNGRDASGDRVSPGVYLLRATTDRGSALHKLVLAD